MSFFSNALDRLMRERAWSQTELERRSGITQSLISRKLKGEGLEGEVLLKLSAPFGQDACELVAAWLQDLTPESMRHSVTIRSWKSDEHKQEKSPPNILEGLPPHAREVITELAAECASRPEMVSALQSLLALTRPRQ